MYDQGSQIQEEGNEGYENQSLLAIFTTPTISNFNQTKPTPISPIAVFFCIANERTPPPAGAIPADPRVSTFSGFRSDPGGHGRGGWY